MSEQALWRRLEWVVVVVLALAIAAYLLKMAYLRLLPGTVLGLLLLLACYGYVRYYRGWRVPLFVVLLPFGAMQVDLLGNHFHLYGKPFGPVQYDEFSHLACSALTVPSFVWLLREAIRYFGYRLPLGLIAILAVSLSFSGAAIYEIIELWDELYFRGKRIWSPHDAPNDLQWDLLGKIAGAAITYLVLRRQQSNDRPQTSDFRPQTSIRKDESS
jgi:uncharacterized membrane protein YjdF